MFSFFVEVTREKTDRAGAGRQRPHNPENYLPHAPFPPQAKSKQESGLGLVIADASSTLRSKKKTTVSA
jgi:hypothetical protein